jgi:formylglycine-generating enzyme required for sulfatase activity
MRLLRYLGYTLSVIVIASLITALGIKASDYFTAADNICPADMVPVASVPGVMCVDAFEVVPGSSCPQQTVENPQSTKGNLAVPTCIPDGGDGELQPWRFVTREEAKLLCARVDKRLPTAGEWYHLALSSPTDSCVFDTEQPQQSSRESTCMSVAEAYHLPGNIWEWVSDDVVQGVYNGRTLPETGYVEAVDETGVVLVSSSTPVVDFGQDYAWTTTDGVMGMVRGGFYRSGDDGGIYAVQANIAPTFASAGIGFRCVR